MTKHNTRYFGEISIDETRDFESIDARYQDRQIRISFSGCNRYGEKMKICLDMLDKYAEMNEIGKKAILAGFPEDKTIKYYFECHFDSLDEERVVEIFGVKTFAELDIEQTVGGLAYPNLLFWMEKDEIHCSVDYKISEEYSDEILCVKMDEKLKVTDFSQES